MIEGDEISEVVLVDDPDLCSLIAWVRGESLQKTLIETPRRVQTGSGSRLTQAHRGDLPARIKIPERLILHFNAVREGAPLDLWPSDSKRENMGFIQTGRALALRGLMGDGLFSQGDLHIDKSVGLTRSSISQGYILGTGTTTWMYLGTSNIKSMFVEIPIQIVHSLVNDVEIRDTGLGSFPADEPLRDALVSSTFQSCKILRGYRRSEQCRFLNTAFTDFEMKGGRYTGCSFLEVGFKDCVFDAVFFEECSFLHTTFRNCKFEQVVFDVQGGSKMEFENCTLNQVKFKGSLAGLSLHKNNHLTLVDLPGGCTLNTRS